MYGTGTNEVKNNNFEKFESFENILAIYSKNKAVTNQRNNVEIIDKSKVPIKKLSNIEPSKIAHVTFVITVTKTTVATARRKETVKSSLLKKALGEKITL